MSVYSLIGMASYSASIGYGITTAAVGIILTCTRILDGITDPLLAFVYDRVNTKFGKLRIFADCRLSDRSARPVRNVTGFSSKGMGLVAFTLLYVVYVIGYTVTNMTAQTIPAIMTNDPRQRPPSASGRPHSTIWCRWLCPWCSTLSCCPSAAAPIIRHF